MAIFKNPAKPYWPLIPVLIVLTALMLWMSNYMPPANLAPKSYSSVIIAFEFILNRQDLVEVLSPLSSEQIQGLDMVNYIDFGYMIVYSSLLAGFTYITQQLNGPRYLIIGIGLALVALFGDFFENIQLLDLTSMYRAEAEDGFASIISNLFLFTWTKWGALALAMALLVPTLFSKGAFSKVISITLSIPAVLLLGCAIWRTSSIIDKFGSSIVFAFLGIAVYIIAYRGDTNHEKQN